MRNLVDLLQDLFRIFPGAFGGGQGETFLRRVNIEKIRSVGYDIQIGHMLAEDSALQTGMNRNNLRLLPVHLLIDFRHQRDEAGFFAERQPGYSPDTEAIARVSVPDS